MNPLQFLFSTYRQLRLTVGCVLIVIPVAIWLVGLLREGLVLPTLSHYYFAETIPGVIRTMFTGFLILAGGILIVYRGFDNKDNWIHNAAGVLAIFVALFPKHCDVHDGNRCSVTLDVFGIPAWWLHAPSAILLFLVCAYGVYYNGGPGLAERLTKKEANNARRLRFGAIFLMSLGIISYGPFLLFNAKAMPVNATLVVELFGFFGFAFYWLGMAYIIDKANRRIRVEEDVGKDMKSDELIP